MGHFVIQALPFSVISPKPVNSVLSASGPFTQLPPRAPRYEGGKAEGCSDRDVERADDSACQSATEQSSGHHHYHHKSPGAEREESAEAAAIATRDNPVDHPTGSSSTSRTPVSCARAGGAIPPFPTKDGELGSGRIPNPASQGSIP